MIDCCTEFLNICISDVFVFGVCLVLLTGETINDATGWNNEESVVDIAKDIWAMGHCGAFVGTLTSSVAWTVLELQVRFARCFLSVCFENRCPYQQCSRESFCADDVRKSARGCGFSLTSLLPTLLVSSLLFSALPAGRAEGDVHALYITRYCLQRRT